MQGSAGIAATVKQVIGDSTGVGHDLNRIFENLVVDSLQHIHMPGIGSDFQCAVDMSVTEIHTAYGLSAKTEGIGRWRNVHDIYLARFLYIVPYSWRRNKESIYLNK